MRKIREIARRRHGLVASTSGSLVLVILCAIGLAVGDPLLRIALAGFGVMLLAGDVLYLASEWLDEWRYQRLVDEYEEARRTGAVEVLDLGPAPWHDEWPVPHDMEERVDMPSYGDVDDGLDVTDTQTGQGIQ